MTIVAILLAASVAAAQEQWDRFAAAATGAIAFRRAIRPRPSFDGGFNFCRLM